MSDYSVKHDYGTSEEAVRELVKLSSTLKNQQIYSPMNQSAGIAKDEVNRLVEEMKHTQDTILNIVEWTREVLRNADEAFKQADAEAELQFNICLADE